MPGRVKLTTVVPAEEISPAKFCYQDPIQKTRKRPASPAPPVPSRKPKSTKEGLDAAAVGPGKPQLASIAAPAKKAASKPREKKFPCTEPGCDKRFARPCRLTEHMRSHTGERPFQCSVGGCDMSFLRESHLKAHTRAKHFQDKRYVCTFVVRDGEEEERGEFGFKRIAGEGGKEVDGGRECGAKFTTNQHLKRHLESHRKGLPHLCVDYPPCNLGFRKRGPLARHIREVHCGVLPWGCPHRDADDPANPCSYTSETKRKLEAHVMSEHNGLPRLRFWCDICQKNPNPPPLEDISTDETAFPIQRTVIPDTTSFKTYRELRAHTNAAHPPICLHCSHRSPSHKALQRHIYNQHDVPLDKRRTHICQICGKGLTKKQYVVTHIRIVHQGLRPFACSECPKTCQYKAALQRHVARAHNPNPETKSEERSKPRKSGALIKKLGLLERLSGYGYESSGRHIPCVVEGCRWRYARMYDLRNHLGSGNGHAFEREQVDELMRALEEGEGDEGSGSEWDNDEIEDEEEGWNEIESGSESDEEWGLSDEDDDL